MKSKKIGKREKEKNSKYNKKTTVESIEKTENRENLKEMENIKEVDEKHIKSRIMEHEENQHSKTGKESRKGVLSIKQGKAKEKPHKEESSKRTSRTTMNIKKLLKEYTLKAGIETEPEVIRKKIFDASLIITLIITIIISYKIVMKGFGFLEAAKLILASWVIVLFASIGICWLMFFVYVDVLIYKRKVEIENVLSDFLQLTSANVRAGMPIDKALWYSIRPRFGVLAKEMETVAKETLSGVSLEDALTKFSQKYDSAILKNSVSLLIEGINAGGEVGYILDRISNNIQETQIIKREMAANVITYVIFITFASILAAPFLMALSYQLLTIINTLGSQMASEQVPNTMGITISFSSIAISPTQFRIFAMIILSVTATFSAMIISIIQKGSIKAGLKLIPTYILISIALFLLLIKITASFFANLF